MWSYVLGENNIVFLMAKSGSADIASYMGTLISELLHCLFDASRDFRTEV